MRRRILIVANRSVATPTLLDEVRRRAEAEPCAFWLLIPDATDPAVAGWTLRRAQRLFGKAADGPVEGIVAQADDPFEAVQAAVADGGFDEILISTLPEHGSGWLRHHLPARVERLGPPVTVVTPSDTVSEADATPR
jgi:DNA-binding transcriptional LysR family regulator